MASCKAKASWTGSTATAPGRASIWAAMASNQRRAACVIAASSCAPVRWLRRRANSVRAATSALLLSIVYPLSPRPWAPGVVGLSISAPQGAGEASFGPGGYLPGRGSGDRWAMVAAALAGALVRPATGPSAPIRGAVAPAAPGPAIVPCCYNAWAFRLVTRNSGVAAAALHGGLGKRARRQTVEALASGDLAAVVATIALISEGVDSPGLDALFLATPMSYGGHVVQALGRVSRPAPGKREAIVYDYTDDHPMLWSSWKDRKRAYERQGCAVVWAPAPPAAKRSA